MIILPLTVVDFNTDCVPDSHIAEEVPNPARNIPIAIGLQMSIGFVTGLVYIIAIVSPAVILSLV
jgi:amino acid transporter